MILGFIYGYLVAVLSLVNILVCHLFSGQSGLSWETYTITSRSSLIRSTWMPLVS